MLIFSITPISPLKIPSPEFSILFPFYVIIILHLHDAITFSKYRRAVMLFLSFYLYLHLLVLVFSYLILLFRIKPFLLGVIICTLLKSLYPSNFFNPSLYKESTKFNILSGFPSSTKKKSFFSSSFSSFINPSPEFTLWAFKTILDFAACLNILSSSITVILSDAIIHFSMLPWSY